MKSLFGDQMSARNFENQQTDLLIRGQIINQMNAMRLPKSVVID